MLFTHKLIVGLSGCIHVTLSLSLYLLWHDGKQASSDLTTTVRLLTYLLAVVDKLWKTFSLDPWVNESLFLSVVRQHQTWIKSWDSKSLENACTHFINHSHHPCFNWICPLWIIENTIESPNNLGTHSVHHHNGLSVYVIS